MTAQVVLIVDDDHGYRFPIANLFSDQGFSVLQADNVESMRELSSKAGVWIVDVRLPTEKMEGIEAVRQLWNDQQRPKVFFISVMPEGTAQLQLRILQDKSIPYRWLEKPFELEVLLTEVNDSLARG